MHMTPLNADLLAILAVWIIATIALFTLKIAGRIQQPWIVVTSIIWGPVLGSIALVVTFFELLSQSGFDI